MNLRKKSSAFLLGISLICITLFSVITLSSCGVLDGLLYVADTKEEYLSGIDEIKSGESASRYDYVSQYLRELGTPVFDINKTIYFEEAFRQYYNLGNGLPDTLTHAALCAEYFAENYFDKVKGLDKATITDAVITSYVNVIGDIYSIYRPKESFDEHLDDMSGSFGGIGVTIELNAASESAVIVEVMIGSPAERAGARAGDSIIAVDGKSIEELGYLNIASHTRGDVGKDVSVTVRRGDETLTLIMTREIIEVKTVEYAISADKIGYVRISSFKENTFEQFVEAIDFLVDEGALGVIFDVRNNPGGYLDTAIDMISYILPTGREIVSYDYKDGRHISKKSVDDKHPETNEISDHTLNIPMAVICNEYSASAAEIFTAAIRDYRDMGLLEAVTVGKTTYKKGIIQASIIYKPDGSSVTLTIAYYAPPSGECYHGVGIAPDYEVELGESADTQMSEAYRLLNTLITN